MYKDTSININSPNLFPIIIKQMIWFNLDEKAREFFFEGQRRTDLIRFGNYGGGTYNWDWKGGVAAGTIFDAHYNIFPLPASALNENPDLLQNPGY